ncbi:hypothetical protein K439DRAFT_1620434 [Ramaria rubella]|nr:hypothetical protein K439DRAFT_1620434 [Ramaria rubella]
MYTNIEWAFAVLNLPSPTTTTTMINSQVSSPSVLHLKLPDCNIRVKVESSHDRPIKIKITPMPDGSVELTLLAVVPCQAPDQESLVSTSTMPSPSPTSSLLEMIDPMLLLGQEPGQSSILQKCSLEPDDTVSETQLRSKNLVRCVGVLPF